MLTNNEKAAKSIFFVNLTKINKSYLDSSVSKLKPYVNFKIDLSMLDNIIKLVNLSETLLIVDIKGVGIDTLEFEYLRLRNMGVQYISARYCSETLDIFNLLNKLVESDQTKNKPLLIADYMRNGICEDPSIKFKHIYGAEFSPVLTICEGYKIPDTIKRFYSYSVFQEKNTLLDSNLGDFIIDNHVILHQADIIQSAKGCLNQIANLIK